MLVLLLEPTSFSGLSPVPHSGLTLDIAPLLHSTDTFLSPSMFVELWDTKVLYDSSSCPLWLAQVLVQSRHQCLWG